MANFHYSFLSVSVHRRIAIRLVDARAIIDRSFPVERFEPLDVDRWDAEYERFQHYVEFTCA